MSEPVSIGLADALLADPTTRKRVERLGGWAGVARQLGARCAFIQTDRGQPCAVLSSGPLTVELLRVAFAGSGVRWFEVFGQRVELGQPRLGGAIEGLRAEGRAVTVEALGAVLGVTDRTLRRYASKEGLVLAEVLDAPVAAPAPPLPVEVPAAAAVEVSVVDPVSPPPGVPPAVPVELPEIEAAPAASPAPLVEVPAAAVVPFEVPAAVLKVRRIGADGPAPPPGLPWHLTGTWSMVVGEGLLASSMLDGQDRRHRGALGWLVRYLWDQSRLDHAEAPAQEIGPSTSQLATLLRHLPGAQRRALVMARWAQWQEHAEWGEAPGPWCWVELAQRSGIPTEDALRIIEGRGSELA